MNSGYENSDFFFSYLLFDMQEYEKKCDFRGFSRKKRRNNKFYNDFLVRLGNEFLLD